MSPTLKGCANDQAKPGVAHVQVGGDGDGSCDVYICAAEFAVEEAAKIKGVKVLWCCGDREVPEGLPVDVSVALTDNDTTEVVKVKAELRRMWPAVAALLAFVVPLACVNWIKDCAEQIVRCAQ